MNTHRHCKFAAGILILLWACACVFASDNASDGPGRLSDLVRDSDFIVVASCVKTQSVDVALYTLDFSVRKNIKGDLKSFTLQLNARSSPVFNTATGPHPSLMFLKNRAGATPDLTTLDSVVSLAGGDAGLPAIIAREMEIRAMPEGSRRNTALKNFLLPLIASSPDTYTKESLSEDLLDLCKAHKMNFTPSELASLFHSATNTDDYKVAVPLALVLDHQNAPQADAAALHVLTDTDEVTKDYSFRLAPVLAKRASLREEYVRKIEQTKDSASVGLMLTELYQVDTSALDPIYERLWKNNPATRTEISHALKQSVTPEHDQLLRRLTSQTPPP